ncbi:MAG: FtsQ-type POTRA domain-containing protein [bacterium]|nr:FtsQ-type POTRA domain-containing protein [bacterium]
MQKRNIFNSPRLKELHKKKNRVVMMKVSVLVFLFLTFLTGLGFLSRLPKLNIQNVTITGNKVVTTEAIEKAIKEELGGFYLSIFPKTNFLFYPKNKIRTRLIDEFTRLKDVTPNIKNMNTLEVFLTERVAFYTWCGDNLSKTELEFKDCYFMDEASYIFEEAPYFSSDVYFRFFGKTEKKNENVLGSVFYPEIWNGIISFKKNITEMGLKPSSMFIKDDGDIELYLISSVSPPDAQKIIFKSNADFRKVAENLQAALTTEPLQSDLKNKYSSLLYIDLRFGNKVYFKFK